MQQKRLLPVLLVLLASVSGGIWYFASQSAEPQHYQSYNEQEVKKQAGSSGESYGASFSGAAKYLHMIQKNPYTNQISMADVKKSIDQAGTKAHAKKSSHIQWESMGPDNVGGRTRAIVIDNNDRKTIYAGGVSGGLWKSTNRGQSWSQMDYEQSDQYKALTVVCMEQASDGTLYFGTGEQGFTSPGAYQGGFGGKTGHIGMGMWKSEDRGETWEHIESTLPGSPMTGDGSPWNNVHELAIDPNNPERILAATDRDVRISNDGGNTWSRANVSSFAVLEVNFSPDGQTVLATTAGGSLYKSTNGGQSFTDITNDAGISSSAERIETAFSPSDPNYIYLSASNNQQSLEGIYKSEDNGQNWEVILEGGSIDDPFRRSRASRGQGGYDNVIAVDPFNKERIFVGGVEFWLYDGQWKKAATENNSPGNETYLHVDHHEIVFGTESDPPVMFSGNDGGIFMSRDFRGNRNPTYKERNLGYTTAQFFAFDVHPNGDIVGGMQDNGSHKLLKGGITGKSYKQVYGNDGFFAAISDLRPEVYIVESQGSNIRRSPDAGNTISDACQVFDDNILADPSIADDNCSGALGTKTLFNTPFQLWESGYDTLSPDSVFYTSDTLAHYPKGTVIGTDSIRQGYEKFFQNDTVNFEQTGNGNYETKTDLANLPGEIVTVVSNNAIEFNDTLETALGVEEDHLLQDVIRTFFVLPLRNEVWVTTDMLKFGQTPEWFKIADADFNMRTPIDLDIGPEGRHIYVGGYNNGNGKLYRISGLRTADLSYDSTGNFNPDSAGLVTEEISTFNGTITGIDFDDNNPERILATAGNYGNVEHIHYSDNALDSAQNVTFTALDNEGGSAGLPQMPVYDGIFLNGSPDTLIVGTEMGVWTHDMGNPGQGWQEINQGMDRVPTHMLRQVKWHEWQKNPKVFAGTHGRGIFRTGSFHTGIEDEEGQKADANDETDQNNVRLYPNPAKAHANIAFDLQKKGAVQVNVYSVSGSLVEQKSYQNRPAGKQEVLLNTSQYETGQYIVQVESNDFAEATKLLVR